MPQCNTIGIDLGTSYASVAVWANDRAEVIANAQGNRTTPCCVAFTQEEELVGETAVNQLVKNPKCVVSGPKRFLGRSFADEVAQSSIADCTCQVRDEGGAPRFVVPGPDGDKVLSPEQTAASILKVMKETAKAFLGAEVTRAVISVPTHFGEAQRKATKEAASLAGLEVLRLINEPTAAAVAYAMDKADDKPPRTILVFDFGASCLDCSLIRVDRGLFEVLATSGSAVVCPRFFTLLRVVPSFVLLFYLSYPILRRRNFSVPRCTTSDSNTDTRLRGAVLWFDRSSRFLLILFLEGFSSPIVRVSTQSEASCRLFLPTLYVYTCHSLALRLCDLRILPNNFHALRSTLNTKL